MRNLYLSICPVVYKNVFLGHSEEHPLEISLTVYRPDCFDPRRFPFEPNKIIEALGTVVALFGLKELCVQTTISE